MIDGAAVLGLVLVASTSGEAVDDTRVIVADVSADCGCGLGGDADPDPDSDPAPGCDGDAATESGVTGTGEMLLLPPSTTPPAPAPPMFCSPSTEVGLAMAPRLPSGLGLRLLKLPIGLANPLPLPPPPKSDIDAGATTDTWSANSVRPSWKCDSEVEVEDAGKADEASSVLSTAAALSSTEGTDCSRVSVPLARGMRCGLGGWWWWLWW